MGERNLATDADAQAAYDEPGSWGRLSEGWAEADYTPAKWLLCTKAHVVPYGQYVVVGAEQVVIAGYTKYDYSKAKIRCASKALRDRLDEAYREMFVECREFIERDLAGDFTK